MTKFIFTLIVAGLIAGSWSSIKALGEEGLRVLEPKEETASSDVLPADWEARYLRGVSTLQQHADRIFERRVSVRADLTRVRGTLEEARAGLQEKDAVLDSLAASIRAAKQAGTSVSWNGRPMGTVEEACDTLAGWEAELAAAESSVQPIARSAATMGKAEHSLANARRRLQARVDAMRRGLGVRKAGLDAAAALKELAAVERIGRGLSEHPDLDEVEHIVTLIDRDLLEAGAREQLRAEEAMTRRAPGSLAEALERTGAARSEQAIEARVQARITGRVR